MDIIGQMHAKRDMEVAAAGGHHLLFCGPPGTGKTILASRLGGILPPLSNSEAMQVASIHSVVGKGLREDLGSRPFRAPHHTASAAALVGGGSSPKPGEISLAHHGILFFDELPEFSRSVLEVLREPLESGQILISRVAAQTRYPASFQLVAAMNPCPCRYLGSKRCICSLDQINRYQHKISGPLLDRIDLQVQVSAIENQQLLDQERKIDGDSNQTIQARVCKARNIQLERQGKINTHLTSQELNQICPLNKELKALLDQAIDRFGLSTRGFYRVLKVARTLADLAGMEHPKLPQYQEALSYRSTIDKRVGINS
jgi:magnesium chelatase family protein